MSRRILITGVTDGIGLAAARRLHAEGHHLLLHGRRTERLAELVAELGPERVDSVCADLGELDAVRVMAAAISADHERIDVLVNNAGVFKTAEPRRADGMDQRFLVNTLAPYLLTRLLLPVIPTSGRIVNLSSAAQAPVDLAALRGKRALGDMPAYAQSKLAITMWSLALAEELGESGPLVVVLNPGSLLATKMVREGFGVAGSDVAIGADIIVRAATGADFAAASGRYFDNDAGHFAQPHPTALDVDQRAALVQTIEDILRQYGVLP